MPQTESLKERLLKVKIPLSDDDYVLLQRLCPLGIWLMGKEFMFLDKAFNDKKCEIFDQVFPGNQYLEEDKTWYPPQTEKYKNHIVNVWVRNDREEMRETVPKIFDYSLSWEERREHCEFIADGLKEYGVQSEPPSWLEWPKDKKWPPHWLVEARLRDIELPLSDDDYVKVHNMSLKYGVEPRFASKELDEEYDIMMLTIYHRLFPDENLDKEAIPWFPPQTEEYTDHPINVRLKLRRSI